MDVLDRIFDGDDMSARVHVAIIDQRRQRSGFTRPGAANKQDKTAFGHDDLGKYFGQAEIILVRNIGNNITDDHRHFVALAEYIDTETTDIGQGDCQVHFRLYLEFTALFVVHDFLRHRINPSRGCRILAQRL